MDSPQDDLAVLHRRLDLLEQEVRALQMTGLDEIPVGSESQNSQERSNLPVRRAGDPIVVHAGQVKRRTLADAKALLHKALVQHTLPALLARAQANNESIGRNERRMLVAFADSQTAYADWPITTSLLMRDQNVQPLATLCAACGNPTRAKLLQILCTRGECSKTELSEASGAVGGNLYQHLGELYRVQLLTQPRRGVYQLTARGRRIVELLFWCADQEHHTEREGSDPDGWFDQEVAR